MDNNESVSGSTNQLVEVTPKRNRFWRSLIKESSRTERRLMIAVIFLFIVALSLFITLIVISSTGRKKICYSAECIKTAAMLLDSMDTRVDPCTDFFKFSCGRWSEVHISQTDTDSWFSDRTRYLASKIAGLLSENATSDEPLALSQAKSLYDSCMNTTTCLAYKIGVGAVVLDWIGHGYSNNLRIPQNTLLIVPANPVRYLF